MESESFRVGGEFLLHAPCLNLSGRRSGAESILHTLLWHLSGFRFVRVSVTHRVMESVGSFGGWGACLKRPVVESVSSLGGRRVSLTSPVLETVWSLVGGGVGGGGVSLHAPCSSLSGLSSGRSPCKNDVTHSKTQIRHESCLPRGIKLAYHVQRCKIVSKIVYLDVRKLRKYSVSQDRTIMLYFDLRETENCGSRT